ncbi:MAG: hypothetical protein F6K21_13365 [Symploca sp. SIO2D2]|nr:hypothetical protein [Symploca sp. SIO2D2]
MTEQNQVNQNFRLDPSSLQIALQQVPPPLPPEDQALRDSSFKIEFKQVTPPPPCSPFFQDLDSTLKRDLYSRLELDKALIVNQIRSEDEDWVISKALKKAIYWDKITGPKASIAVPEKNGVNDHPNWSVPRKIASLTVNVSNSRVSHELVKFASKQTSTQEFSLLGVGSNSNQESSQSSSQSVTNKSYLLAEYKVQKLILSVDFNKIQLEQEFTEKLKEIFPDLEENSEPEDNEDDEWSDFIRLNYLLNEYGYFVPLKFELGGKISAQQEVNSRIDSDSQEYKSFGSSVAAQLNFFQPSAMSSETKTSGKHESNQKMFQQDDIELEYYGGMGAATAAPSLWISSLEYYPTWQVIGYSNFVPIICFFDKNLQNKVIHAFIRYAYYPDTDKPLLIDGIRYASMALDIINQQELLQGGSEKESPDVKSAENEEQKELQKKRLQKKKRRKLRLASKQSTTAQDRLKLWSNLLTY